MKLWSIILLFSNCFFHWTTGVSLKHKSYVVTIEESALKNVTVTNDTFNVDLSHFRINFIEKNALDGLMHIENLDLSGNTLQSLESSIFSKLKNLKKLSLHHNSIDFFNWSFVGLDNLEVLDLAHNQIYQISPGDFDGLPKSTNIIIEGNPLHNIVTSAGKQLKRIRETTISALKNVYRRSVEQYPVRVCQTADGILESVQGIGENDNCTLGNCIRALKMFQTQRNTIQLILRDITSFKCGWYGHDLQYDSIDLSSNYITKITPVVINDLPSNVSHIDLSFNRIGTIENIGLENQHIRSINIGHNILSIIEDDALGKFNFTVLDVSWNRLNSMAFVRTLPASIEELYCQHNQISEIPNDSFRHLENLVLLVMTDNNMREIKRNTFEFLKNLVTLDLSSNHILRVEPKSFQFSEELNYIHLIDNEIEDILKDTFNKNLAYLDISSNKIQNIESGSFSNMNLRTVLLSHNKITENSILNGAFNGSAIKVFDLSHNLITKIDGRKFEGISIGHKLKLKENLIRRIEKGTLDDILGVPKLEYHEI